VVDLLDYDVRLGQGFLFAPPRPLRPEGAPATNGNGNGNGHHANGQANTQEINGVAKGTGTGASSAIEPPPRSTGNAALARRAAGPAA
jgi:cyclic-di-GMP phosphodiesterase, flagellum assembly factor TipF